MNVLIFYAGLLPFIDCQKQNSKTGILIFYATLIKLSIFFKNNILAIM